MKIVPQMKIANKKLCLSSCFICLLAALLISCSINTESGSLNKDLLPNAAGDIAEVLVVIEAGKWAGPVGQFIKENLGATMPGLPQDEPLFTLRRIDPLKMNSVLKTAKNIIYVTLLDDNSKVGLFMRNNITEESLVRIKNEPGLFMFTKKDEYAIGQEITHLFGINEQALLNNLNNNKERLLHYFEKTALERTATKLYSAAEKKNLSNKLMQDHQFSLKIPAGYDLAKEENNFVWLRFLDPRVDKSIIVYYKDYTSQDVFQTENLLALREEVSTRHLRDIEKPDIYITYQDVLPMESKATTFNGEFAMEAIGLWRVSDNSAGGPYKSYAFVDPELNRLYYIEGFVRAPGKDKREPLRELQVIMETFKSQSQAEDHNNS